MLYLILINPFSKRFDNSKIKKIKRKLDDKNIESLILESHSKDYFQKKIPEILENNREKKIKVIIVGGDGTINNVCNVLAKLNSDNISIGVIPSGTANILAKEFNIPDNINEQINIILNAQSREIYLSKINNFYFIFTCGIGIDGKIVKEVENNIKLKNRLGAIAYVWKGLKILKNPGMEKFKVKIDNIVDYEVESIIINRTQRYGLNKKIFKTAYIISDYFVCALIKKVNYSSLLKFFLGINSEDIIFRKAKILEIKTSKNLPIQVDGEFIDISPEIITISDKKLKFILP